jgi:hypothetical protein
VSEIDWERNYTTLLRQTEPVIRAVERVVPTNVAGMHPNLVALFEVAQAWRNMFTAEDFDPSEIAESWAVMQAAKESASSDTIALLATFEAVRMMMVSKRPDYEQRGRDAMQELLQALAAALDDAGELDTLVATWAPEAKRMGLEW